MAAGYIKLWRKTLDSGVLQNHKAWSLLGWLFLSVTRKRFRYYGKVLDPGEILIPIPEVAVRLEMSVDELRGAIKFLEKLEIITTSADWAGKRMTRFHVNNWRRYQEENLGKIAPIEQDEIELEMQDNSELRQSENRIATGLPPDSYIMNKKEENNSNTPTKTPQDSKAVSRPTQRLKDTLSGWDLELHLVNFYPVWDSRSPRFRGTYPAEREKQRQAWIDKFKQEPLQMPDFDVAANSRGDYGNVLLRPLWEDLRGQELARKFQP